MILRVLAVLLMLNTSQGADQAERPEQTQVVFSNWAGPAIIVRLYVPKDAMPTTPIVIVMHGASRDAIRYFADWRTQGKQQGFIVVVPEFSKDQFAKSAHYNLGHVFDPETGQRRPEQLWTFSAIEPLFDEVVAIVGGQQTQYTIFGHSAGAQFVHRFVYYKPAARAGRAIVANAGWYTMPDFGVAYPYGLAGSGIDQSTLVSVLSRDVVILLGDGDIDENADNFRKTPEAELQGPHRLARGRTMYRVAKARALQAGIEFNWQVHVVAGAGHVNAAMTPVAASFVR